MSKLNIDINQEVKDITTGLTEIANYLITPEKDDKDSNSSNSGDNNSNNSSDNGKSKDKKSDNKNKDNENSNNSSDSGNKKDENNKSSKSSSSGKDPQQELKDSLNELNDLLNQKSPKKDNDSSSNSQDGLGGEPSPSNQSSKGNPSGGELGEPGQTPFDYKGLHIDPNEFQDIHAAKNDENKTERELNNEIQAMVRQAVNEARNCGKGTGRMITLWEQLVKPEPPKWVNILNPYLRPDNNVNWLYNKAHKNRLTIANGGKMLFRGAERPKEKLKDLCIALDNSGSISSEDFSKFYNTVAGFLQLRKNVRGWVCWWDTEISGWDDRNNKPNGEEKGYGEFKDYPSFKKVKNIGGGGTDPECALRFAKAHDCKYVIIFTDGGFSVPDKKWENQFTKILWVICNKKEYERFDPSWGIKCL